MPSKIEWTDETIYAALVDAVDREVQIMATLNPMSDPGLWSECADNVIHLRAAADAISRQHRRFDFHVNGKNNLRRG